MLNKRSSRGAKTDLSVIVNQTSLCKDVNEQFLFHGTKQHLVEPIYSQRGFDWRLAGAYMIFAQIMSLSFLN